MKNIIQLIVSSFLLAVSATVQAQECCPAAPCFYENSCCIPNTNFYAKVFGGANFLENTTISGHKAKFSTGYIVAGSLGYGWCNGLNLEAEYAFRRNNISKIDFFGEGSSHHGHSQTSSYMANLIWDLSSWGCLFYNSQPFIGAGIGYDFQQIHSSNSRVLFNEKRHHFAWQVMAGLDYPIFCNTKLTLEYKFHRGCCHFHNHSIGLGLAYTLGWR